jgi:hypothetical protein
MIPQLSKCSLNFMDWIKELRLLSELSKRALKLGALSTDTSIWF